jgi:hypothetical protein
MGIVRKNIQSHSKSSRIKVGNSTERSSLHRVATTASVITVASMTTPTTAMDRFSCRHHLAFS